MSEVVKVLAQVWSWVSDATRRLFSIIAYATALVAVTTVCIVAIFVVHRTASGKNTIIANLQFGPGEAPSDQVDKVAQRVETLAVAVARAEQRMRALKQYVSTRRRDSARQVALAAMCPPVELSMSRRELKFSAVPDTVAVTREVQLTLLETQAAYSAVVRFEVNGLDTPRLGDGTAQVSAGRWGDYDDRTWPRGARWAAIGKRGGAILARNWEVRNDGDAEQHDWVFGPIDGTASRVRITDGYEVVVAWRCLAGSGLAR